MPDLSASALACTEMAAKPPQVTGMNRSEDLGIVQQMKRDLDRRLARFFNRSPVELKQGVACVSVTFDDVPMTACRLGAEIVESQGARATFFVSGKFDSAHDPERFHTSKILRDLNSRGHEIGCHGFGHLQYQNALQQNIIADISANRSYFQYAGLPEAKSFAYPFGGVSPSVKRICGNYYSVCRGINAGINQRMMDSGLLRAVPLYDSRWSTAKSKKILQRVKQEGGLLVFFSHGIETNPGDYDCSPKLLETTLKIADDLGVEIKSLSKAVPFVSLS